MSGQDKKIIEKCVEIAKKKKATLSASWYVDHRASGARQCIVKINANKQIFKTPFMRGGVTTDKLLGMCQFQATAVARVESANKLIKKLMEAK